jgi:hypothetical protein
MFFIIGFNNLGKAEQSSISQMIHGLQKAYREAIKLYPIEKIKAAVIYKKINYISEINNRKDSTRFIVILSNKEVLDLSKSETEDMFIYEPLATFGLKIYETVFPTPRGEIDLRWLEKTS